MLHPVLPGRQAADGELIGDEPVPERRVIVVDVQRRLDQLRISSVPARHWLLLPRIERLTGKWGPWPAGGSGPWPVLCGQVRACAWVRRPG
jgi:hypothetical protein